MAQRAHRKTRTGRVTSDKADKTITVAVETLFRHRLYKKTLKQTQKFMADDPKNEAKVGDLVEIMELPKSDHPFYLGTQGHPEYKSRPLEPHAIFLEYFSACIKKLK